MRYGHNIGLANRRIEEGTWVREELVELPAAPSLDDLPRSPKRWRRFPPLEGYTFEGYRNADGSTDATSGPICTTTSATSSTLPTWERWT